MSFQCDSFQTALQIRYCTPVFLWFLVCHGRGGLDLWTLT